MTSFATTFSGLSREFMPTDAMRLLNSLCGYSSASQDIFAMSDQLKMGWVYAAQVSTQVIQVHPTRLLAMKELVAHDMSIGRSALRTMEVPVTISLKSCQPHPTSVTFRSLNLLEKSIRVS